MFSQGVSERVSPHLKISANAPRIATPEEAGPKAEGLDPAAGHPIIYASTSIALAALEYTVHTTKRPADSVLITIELPSDSILSIEKHLTGPLPANWPFVEAQTQDYRNCDWLNSRSSIALEIPSIVIPLERNLLLNPKHPSFDSVELVNVLPFFFDPRIFKTGIRQSKVKAKSG